ncbi:MAG: low affinity iron permease family protein [Gammaproteobacteria bacterium]|nr:low affinity iron permease family protein [Gammaproteobacteria bacterium]
MESTKNVKDVKNGNKEEPKGFFDRCSDLFHKMAVQISKFVGNAWVFIFMFLMVLIWLITGPFFGYSDTWQLVINTSTSVITFLIVFIIQNTQNRDTIALNLKLDELIRVHKLAQNSIIDLDKLTEDQIKELEKSFCEISKKNENS